MVDNFFDDFNITSIPREENSEADALAIAGSTFKPPSVLKVKHEVDLRYQPSILDNVKHWQVFEDGQHIKIFLELVEEFSTTHIDQDGVSTTQREEEEESLQRDEEE